MSLLQTTQQPQTSNNEAISVPTATLHQEIITALPHLQCWQHKQSLHRQLKSILPTHKVTQLFLLQERCDLNPQLKTMKKESNNSEIPSVESQTEICPQDLLPSGDPFPDFHAASDARDYQCRRERALRSVQNDQYC